MIDWADVVRWVFLAVWWFGMWRLFHRLDRRRSHRQLTTGRTILSARWTASSSHPVLSPLWQDFRAVPHPGRLYLRHWLIDDEVSSITVDSVAPGERRPRWRDTWRMRVFDARVLTVHTPEGPAELAVRADQVEWLRDRLAGADLRSPE